MMEKEFYGWNNVLLLINCPEVVVHPRDTTIGIM